MIGETLGSYRVVQKIGTGGMGIVYLAVHPLLGRKAVIKLLLPQYSNNPQVVTRFFHEAKASALIGHPGIIDIFDFGHSERGDAFLVMEFLDGESLAARIKRERILSPPLAVAITRQVTSALTAAHQKGIVHRDLKPDNLFLLPDRDSSIGFRMKVLDFGIAKLAREAIAGAEATNAGATIGTPKYMAPEQCLDAAKVDARADIYSLGCIVFEMICGRPPFRADTYAEMLAQHIATPPPAPSALVEGVPPELETVILRSLEKDLGRRYQTMDEMSADLDRLAQMGLLPNEKPAAIAHREPTEALPQVTPAPVPMRTPPPAVASAQVTVPGRRGPAAVAVATQESTMVAAMPILTPSPVPLMTPSPLPASLPMAAPTPSPMPVAMPGPVAVHNPLAVAPTVAMNASPAPPVIPPGVPMPAARAALHDSGDRLNETSTTLGGAASEVHHTHSRPVVRRAVLPAAAVGVVLGLAGVAVAIFVAQDEKAPSPAASAVERPLAPSASSSSPAESTLPGAAPLATAGSPPPAGKLVTLRVESEPSGADVYRTRDGIRLGKTPFIQHVPPADGEAAFILRKSGFREARVTIPYSRDGIGYVQLEKVGKTVKKKGKEREPARATSAPARKKPRPIKDGALDPFGE